MYIKSVVIDGFKSYGNRVEVTGFDTQFNAITGLNGSGKSNILDSICFVLGITNLSSIRAGSLQELIYKSGQAGVNRATVSVTFDNSDESRSPPGFEQCDEITVTRQIAIGGKTKYLINGSNVTNKRVQDLFCSVQLNVNNPHFLIMQGRITKVLNMKPIEILSMIEEAAGTRMYESKRQTATRMLDKKDAKLVEMDNIYETDLKPRLERFKQERSQYLEFQRIERELEHMTGLFQAYKFFASQRHTQKAQSDVNKITNAIVEIEETIAVNEEQMQACDDELNRLTAVINNESKGKLREAEAQLKACLNEENAASLDEKASRTAIEAETKKIHTLEKNIKDETKILTEKEAYMTKVQGMFEGLKEADRVDNEALEIARKKFNAISAGMEVNDAGEAQTLQEQLMIASDTATKSSTNMANFKNQLAKKNAAYAEKSKALGTGTADYQRDVENSTALESKCNNLKKSLAELNFSEDGAKHLRDRRAQLQGEVRRIDENINSIENQHRRVRFDYTKPGPNFDTNDIIGMVCKLFKVKDQKMCTALETAVGGKIYNVIVANEGVAKLLLKNGNLQTRTTFIPLNKITGRKVNKDIVNQAKELAGDKVRTAISLVEYDRRIQTAMEFIFGDTFIADDIETAKRVAFHPRILRRCVTLDGDVCDPSGVMSGGARERGEPLLLNLDRLKQFTIQQQAKINELDSVDRDFRNSANIEQRYVQLKDECDRCEQQLAVVRLRLNEYTHHQQKQEIDNLEAEISMLKGQLAESEAVHKESTAKLKSLQTTMKDSKGHRDRQMKQAERDIKAAQAKAEKSAANWRQREQEYESLRLEIEELRGGLETARTQVAEATTQREALSAQLSEKTETASEKRAKKKQLEEAVKAEKQEISNKNKELHKLNQSKENLLSKNNELTLEIQKRKHTLKQFEEALKLAETEEATYARTVKKVEKHLADAEKMQNKEANDLQRRIQSHDEKKKKLGRNVNVKAQAMLDHEEKQFEKLMKKMRVVSADRNNLVKVVAGLDQQKKSAIILAHEQISKDLGSIFASLLPGGNAKLVVPDNMTILQGLEVKVSLGGVWKESLSELSGGQRSLIALSLVLAMLLFKPAPLYILDEVDSALDASHTQNIGQMLKAHFKQSQFILVSLKDGMFTNANVLFRTKFIDGMSCVTRTVNKNAGTNK